MSCTQLLSNRSENFLPQGSQTYQDSAEVQSFLKKSKKITIEDFHDDKWVTALVFYMKNGEETFRPEIVNLETEQRYVFEEMSATSAKAGMLATFGIPFYTMFNMALHVARLAVLLISISAQIITDLLTKFSAEAVKNVFINLTIEIPTAIFQTIWSLAKAPICSIGMEFCAICAIFSPITWRAHLATVEKFWRGTDRLHHLNSNKATEEWAVDFFTNPHSKYGWFLAYCFQPWGTLSDSNVCRVNGQPKLLILAPTV